MARILAIVALIVAGHVASSKEASAQRRPGFGRSGRPTTSPYLNLLRRAGGGGIGFNYFQRVRPEQEFRRNNARLGRSLNTLTQQVNRQGQELKPGAGLGQTGHGAVFMNLGNYFPGFSGSGIRQGNSQFGLRR